MGGAEETELLRRYLPFIEGFFRARVACPEDAEDLSQEAAAAVVRSWPRFGHRSAPTTWIYAVCRNVLCGHLRRRGVPQVELREEETAVAARDRDRTDEFAAALALERVSAAHRRLYELYYRQGYSVREVARAVGSPEGTVKYELYRLREALRRELG